ncbi:28S ribosomal protein S33, mitochondrial-like [Mizuhopecten yessoensis]|uniref:Small ribosomal subunit protein mS33 n=1 Tax=Mizuhopecten yessoensis TaxID=6573 RepID=A0A210PG91_MIZYE|nr:28S ribosomal protein S33, mitochondrial-like [Mizuhopecten yessoensis]OWF35513.1 28S ribosomal protein S33, mitochondrial [Mizuhopecten yessoensis]
MSQYSLRMGRLAARIFGDVARPTNTKSRRVERMFKEKPFYLRPEVVDYYPNYKVINRLDVKLGTLGMFRDTHLGVINEIQRLNVIRGKVKPEKGKGRRATRR